MTELLPCPFCGEQAKIVHERNLYWVRCSAIDCFASSYPHMLEDETIAKWNRRTPLPQDERATLTAQVANKDAEIARLNATGLAELERDKAILQGKVWELEAALAFVREQRQGPTVPDDVRTVLKTAMDIMRNDLAFGTLTLAPHILAHIDATRNWLDALPREGIAE